MPVLLRVPHRFTRPVHGPRPAGPPAAVQIADPVAIRRRQDRPLLPAVLYSASRRRYPSPNPDGSAAAWPLWLTGNSPGSTETTMGTILYTTDPNATTGFREATFEELIAGARHALAIRVRRGAVMTSPNAARDYLTMRLAPRDHEVFTILFLDSRHRLIDCLEIFRGTIDGASVHAREVVKEALARNAAAVILSHNHPSGVARDALLSMLRCVPAGTSVCRRSLGTTRHSVSSL